MQGQQEIAAQVSFYKPMTIMATGRSSTAIMIRHSGTEKNINISNTCPYRNYSAIVIISYIYKQDAKYSHLSYA